MKTIVSNNAHLVSHLPQSDRPSIWISPIGYAAMQSLVNSCPKEIGWLHTVFSDQEKNVYLLDRILVLPQKVHSSTTEMDPIGLQEALTPLLAKQKGIETISRILAWGHSHVRMNVFASGQDDAQMEVFKKNQAPFMVRLIGNQKGHWKVDLFDYENNIVHQNLRLRLTGPRVNAHNAKLALNWAKKQINEKVRDFSGKHVR